MKTTALLLSLLLPLQASDEEDDVHTTIDFSDLAIDGAMMAPEGAYLQATYGGAQDAELFRDRALAGSVPRPGAITAEGLFSQHDLPASAVPCRVLLCPVTDAAPAELVTRPDVTHLVQVAFSSGIDAKTFRRAPLNLVLVVDRSGSMQGQKIALVRATLRDVADKLGEGDELSIVTFDDTARVHLRPTAATRRQTIQRAIETIEVGGGTSIEAGLHRAFAVAQGTKRFDGSTRVMLFTDAQPNVGDTSARGFIEQAEAAARRGVGLTTIGVGIDFGAELATRVASVPGGNLFYFPDPARMKTVIDEDFELMTTELGRDLSLTIRPAPHLRIAGLFGIPETVVKRDEDGAVRVSVATIFASKKSGAMFVALAIDEPGLEVARLGEIELSFTESGGLVRSSRHAITAASPTLGLRRGAPLVDAFVGVREAAERFHDQGDRAGALERIRPVVALFRATKDESLREERPMLEALYRTLGGDAGEAPIAQRDPRR